jgi:hypothetical protein
VIPVGLEPTNPLIKSQVLYQLSYEIIVTPEGFEPPLTGPKPVVLPLDEGAICGIQYVKELSNKKPLTEFPSVRGLNIFVFYSKIRMQKPLTPVQIYNPICESHYSPPN